MFWEIIAIGIEITQCIEYVEDNWNPALVSNSIIGTTQDQFDLSKLIERLNVL